MRIYEHKINYSNYQFMNILKNKWVQRFGALVVVAFVGMVYTYFFGGEEESIASAKVVETVEAGTVSTSIETTGEIVAAEILDLDVYKLDARIDELGVSNGAHVEEGDLLFAFDQSDVAIEIAASQIDVEEAQLALSIQQEESGDINTTIASLKNEITQLETDLSQYGDDKETALRDFLNKNIEAVPTDERYKQQVSDTAPTLGGVYNSTEKGEYHLVVYASGEESGYSYKLSGLEGGVYPVYVGKEVNLGTRGLTITFSANGLSAKDEWVISLPNTEAPEYPDNLDDYNDAIERINESIESDTVSLANKKTQLAQAQRGDTSFQRELSVETASLAVSRAQVDLQDKIDQQGERYIEAPFSGTVTGMDNVVVGATPTNDSSDPVTFGSLISDEFHASFSLGASDIDKVYVGQKVEVTLTSISGSEPLMAEIVEVSSLPDSSTVAQYGVLALVTEVPEGINLRDGMLADIAIIQEEKEDVVRVPSSAVSYDGTQAQVTVLMDLSDQELKQVERMGILRVTDTSAFTSYKQDVEIGLVGQYYVEILSGLEEGTIIEVSSVSVSSDEDTSVVDDARMGPGGGGGNPPAGAAAMGAARG